MGLRGKPVGWMGIDKEVFIDEYMKMKNKGMSDKEISKVLFISERTLYNYKKKVGFNAKPPYHRKNDNFLTFEELRIAEENGISRKLAHQRVREWGWKNQKAITEPKREYRKKNI